MFQTYVLTTPVRMAPLVFQTTISLHAFAHLVSLVLIARTVSDTTAWEIGANCENRK